MAKKQQTVGDFLFDYIHSKGARHVFGIPGDFALPTFRQLEQSNLEIITMTHEPSVGFAADAYARQMGLGVALVTYCVGGLNLLNPVACAYAEKSPLLVISGGPSPRERQGDAMIHHKVRTFDTQRRIFEEVTCANTVLTDPETAANEIMRVIDAVMEQCRPGYIEVPYDVVDLPIAPPQPRIKQTLVSDSQVLAAGIADAVEFINRAKQPVIIAGVELHRHGTTDKAVKLAQAFDIPIAADILSKSVIRETNPHYIGVFSGNLSDPKCKEYVDNSDCVILLGTFVTDVFFGFIPTELDKAGTILVTTEKCRVGYRTYDNVRMEDFMDALLAAPVKKREGFVNPNPVLPLPSLSEAEKAGEILVPHFFNVLAANLGENDTITCDVGDALFGAVELRTRQRSNFIADAFYLSMGFAVPATFGAIAAKRAKGETQGRVFAIVGDGAFQMTGIEFSSTSRFGMAPIVIVMNNDGYGTQRHIIDGPFNNLQRWNYSMVPQMTGVGKGVRVSTPAEFDAALKEAINSDQPYLIEAIIPKNSSSNSLRRVGEGLSSQRDVTKRPKAA
jgi:indolepyruvate decarboxylase